MTALIIVVLVLLLAGSVLVLLLKRSRGQVASLNNSVKLIKQKSDAQQMKINQMEVAIERIKEIEKERRSQNHEIQNADNSDIAGILNGLFNSGANAGNDREPD